MIGASIALMGVSQLLAPSMKTNMGNREKADAQPSYFISGNINMTEEGQSIPILYGRFLSGTMLLNASLEVVDLL